MLAAFLCAGAGAALNAQKQQGDATDGAAAGGTAGTTTTATASEQPQVPLQLENNGLKIIKAIAMQRDQALRLFLIVQNVSDKEITVPTANMSMTVMNYEPAPLYQTGLDSQVSYQGVPIIPAISHFNPVTLRPGEGAEIVADYELRRERIPKRSEGESVVIGYYISSENAKRLGFWQGSLVSEPVEVLKTPNMRSRLR